MGFAFLIKLDEGISILLLQSGLARDAAFRRDENTARSVVAQEWPASCM